jgi:hypothetical protein
MKLEGGLDCIDRLDIVQFCQFGLIFFGDFDKDEKEKNR